MSEAKKKVALAWSGGKDACMALEQLRHSDKWEVVVLFTTVGRQGQRATMHEVPISLVKEQADALGLPLETIELPERASLLVYNTAIGGFYRQLQQQGIEAVAFGDLFLEDLRQYREQELQRHGLEGVFPLWGSDTAKLAAHFVESGAKAWVVCANQACLSVQHCGRWYDYEFLNSLPDGVDWCGERGEFHTFVAYAPGFSREVFFEAGEKYAYSFGSADELPGYDTGFWYQPIYIPEQTD